VFVPRASLESDLLPMASYMAGTIFYITFSFVLEYIHCTRGEFTVNIPYGCALYIG
jgi:hypothetical protein